MKQADNISVNPLDGELLDAVIANNASAVEKLLSAGANPNCFEDKCQIRPLHFAAVYNSYDTLFPLVKAGAKMEALTSDGYSPLDIAIQLKHHHIIEILKMLSTNLISLY
ncbi:MAG: hypothetical protein A3F41_00390 [Coxiella sp. RIFCSPHIGHO2_12_FULL_44_14]|nr:MAG: hypothetical protein A3F41_00390 [Coxiella sp. RIFCSPHIGHO2_12_FULL_44_14]